MNNGGIHEHLILHRNISATDQEFCTKFAQGGYATVVRGVLMDVEKYQALAPWDLQLAKIYALSQTCPKAVISGLAAARLHRIPVWWEREELILVTLRSGPGPGGGQVQAGVKYANRRLSDKEITKVDGISVTTLDRTVADIATHHGLHHAVVFLDALWNKFPHLNLENLRQIALGSTRFRGRSTLRRAFTLTRPNVESPLETLTRLTLIDAGLSPERIEVQQWVSLGGQHLRVDLVVDGWLCIECDGRIKYDGHTFGRSTDDALRQEREREKLLINAGISLIRVSYDELESRTGGTDGECTFIRNVRAAFRRKNQAVTLDSLQQWG